jgi:hypothetical protein
VNDDFCLAVQVSAEGRLLFVATEVAEDEQLGFPQGTGEGVDVRVLGKQHREIAELDDRVGVPEPDEPPVVVEDGAGVASLGFGVDAGVVRVDDDPRLPCRKAGVGESSHCIGVRALSRLTAARLARI